MTLTESVHGTAGVATVTLTWVVSLDFLGRKLSDSLGMGSVLRTFYSRPSVSGGGLNTEGGRETPVVERVGDKAVYPVIVDFNTGKVEGVSVAALARLQIYDC